MIEIQSSTLKEALKQVGPAIDRRSVIKAFQCVRLRIDGTQFEMIGGGTEGQATHRAALEFPVSESLDVCVEADRLAPLLAVANDSVSITIQKNERVKFATSSYNVAIPSLPGSVFPMVKADDQIKASTDVSGIAGLIGGVLFAANPRDIREFCRGVWIESDGEQISATATNGNVLATAQVPMAAAPFAVLISTDAAEMLVALDPQNIALTDAHFTASNGATDLVIKPMSFKPVDWRRTLPDPKNSITFEGAPLRDAVSMYRHYGDKIGGLRFSTEGEECTLEVVNTQNDATVDLDVEFSDEESTFNFAFIGAQLSQILQRAPDEKVTFFWNASNPRAFLVQNGNWRGVISPLTV
ncbi:hypothetical protein [Paraburkholderia sp.]|uniref:hypothetical protein n=1 Tax=Paraburkholderia sp. TaxID=1926495 RepID=UPI00286EC878|nr:hypothetical protein [Paraburkholderia sp.]